MCDLRRNGRKYVRYEHDIDHKIRFSQPNLNFLGQLISISNQDSVSVMKMSVVFCGRESDAEAFKRDVSG